MKEVIAYCRVACAKQSDPSAEAQRQEQMIRRYADARGLIICDTYLDAGVSGGTLEARNRNWEAFFGRLIALRDWGTRGVMFTIVADTAAIKSRLHPKSEARRRLPCVHRA